MYTAEKSVMLRNASFALACATGVSLLMVSAQGQAPSRNGPPREVRRVTDFVPYQYIVVLKHDAESRRNAGESRRLAESHGARIEHVHEHTLNAFTIDAPTVMASLTRAGLAFEASWSSFPAETT